MGGGERKTKQRKHYHYTTTATTFFSTAAWSHNTTTNALPSRHHKPLPGQLSPALLLSSSSSSASPFPLFCKITVKSELIQSSLFTWAVESFLYCFLGQTNSSPDQNGRVGSDTVQKKKEMENTFGLTSAQHLFWAGVSPTPLGRPRPNSYGLISTWPGWAQLIYLGQPIPLYIYNIIILYTLNKQTTTKIQKSLFFFIFS